MAGCRISGLMEYVVKSTGCSPAVSDISFSQPASCFESVIKSGSVMSELSRVLNIFPTPVTHANLLRPTFDCEVPTHLNQDFDYRRLQDAPVVTPPHFSVFDYIDRCLNFLEVVRFLHMWTDGNELKMRKRFGERHYTACQLGEA